MIDTKIIIILVSMIPKLFLRCKFQFKINMSYWNNLFWTEILSTTYQIIFIFHLTNILI